MLGLIGAAVSLVVAAIAVVVWQHGGLAGRGGFNAACSATYAAALALISIMVTLGVLRLGKRWAAIRILLGAYFFVSLLIGLELVAAFRYPRVPGGVTAFESAPEVGWQLKPNFNGLYAGVPLITNADGFRSPPISLKTNPNVVRVICLGDSVTFGQGSDAEYAYPQILQGLLNKQRPEMYWDVVNTGVPGYCTFQETHQLRRCLEHGYRPRLVILLICLNDITEKYTALRSFGGTGLGFQGVPDGTGAWFFRSIAHLRHYSGILTALTPTTAEAQRREAYAVRLLWEQPYAAQIEEAWQQQEIELDKLVDLNRSEELGLLLAVVPYRSQLANPRSRNAPQRRLSDYSQEHKLAFLDLMPALLREAELGGMSPESFFLDDSHLTAQGNGVVAQAVAEAFKDSASVEPPLGSADIPGEGGAGSYRDVILDHGTSWAVALRKLASDSIARKP